MVYWESSALPILYLPYDKKLLAVQGVWSQFSWSTAEEVPAQCSSWLRQTVSSQPAASPTVVSFMTFKMIAD